MFKFLAITFLISTLAVSPALAGSLTFDLGNAGQPGSQTTTSETTNGYGIFVGGGAVNFTNSGVLVSATAFGGNLDRCGNDQCYASTYVTQKTGAFGPGETGIGESDNQNIPSDPDLEVEPNKYLALNNTGAIAAGYHSSELVIESLQQGEGVQIYGVNSLGSHGSLDISKLTSANLLATLIGCYAPGCTGGVTQYVTLNNNYKYFVLTATAPDGTPDDFVLSEDILNSAQVPEPATFALLGFGALGLLALRRSRPNSSM